MTTLDQVYDAEEFKRLGHILIDQLADNLGQNIDRSQQKVLDYLEPDDHYQFWQQEGTMDTERYFEEVMHKSIQLHHPKFMGHQVTPPAPLAALAAMQGALLNSGGAVYEMAAASSALEKVVIDRLKPYFGFFEGDGIITSGGTIANLTALICARNIKASENVWQEGQTEKYAFMVSEEAHYCIDRAVRIMGWGSDGIIKVPVDDRFTMKTELLDELYQKATEDGITVLGVVGSAPTTSTGIYDNLKEIGLFCKENNLWYHIDAAHGGPAVFSEKHKFLMDGCDMADSITVDAHKMMMVPSLTTMLFFKDGKDSYRTFAQQAQYLWSASDEEWYNYGKRTMECTKIMLSTRIYAMINAYDVSVFGDYVTQCYDMAKTFADMIIAEDGLELAVFPDSNIVCFRVLKEDEQNTNDWNIMVRNRILRDGKFYIVQTKLNGQVYLRVSLMNPFTNAEDLRELLDTIKNIT